MAEIKKTAFTAKEKFANVFDIENNLTRIGEKNIDIEGVGYDIYTANGYDCRGENGESLEIPAFYIEKSTMIKWINEIDENATKSSHSEIISLGNVQFMKVELVLELEHNGYADGTGFATIEGTNSTTLTKAYRIAYAEALRNAAANIGIGAGLNWDEFRKTLPKYVHTAEGKVLYEGDVYCNGELFIAAKKASPKKSAKKKAPKAVTETDTPTKEPAPEAEEPIVEAAPEVAAPIEEAPKPTVEDAPTQEITIDDFLAATPATEGEAAFNDLDNLMAEYTDQEEEVIEETEEAVEPEAAPEVKSPAPSNSITLKEAQEVIFTCLDGATDKMKAEEGTPLGKVNPALIKMINRENYPWETKVSAEVKAASEVIFAAMQ